MGKDVTQKIIARDIHSDVDTEAFDFMKEVAFGFETGSASEVIRKFKKNVYLKVHTCNSSGVTSDMDANDFAEISSIVTELNSLIDTIDIVLVNTSVTDICESETHALYTSGTCYKAGWPRPNLNLWICPRSRWETISGLDATGLGGQFAVGYNGATGEMHTAVLWAMSGGTLSNRMSIIREEITQSLGIGKDSATHSDSIFYEDTGEPGYNTAYSELDKKVIQMLYDPRVELMMNRQQVGDALKKPSAGNYWTFKPDSPNNSGVEEGRLTDRFNKDYWRE